MHSQILNGWWYECVVPKDAFGLEGKTASGLETGRIVKTLGIAWHWLPEPKQSCMHVPH